jgi:small subunit ribosomal protein S9
MMADDEKPETPADEPDRSEIGEHDAPSEQASEIASVSEDAPLEALQEAAEASDAAEGSDAAAEGSDDTAAEGSDDSAAQGKADTRAERKDDAAAEGSDDSAAQGKADTSAERKDDTAAEGSDDGAEEEAEEPTPRVKPSVPGAHLEVDIVPEGVDPLGRTEGYEDPYAIEDEAAQAEEGGEEDEREEVLSEPIATATIDLAAGARYRATGKRKTAIARVTLRPGSGAYLVNGRALEEHFPRATLQRNIRQPLETVGYQERMDVVVRLHGGGISAQAGALRHGVSRALLEADPNLRGELKRRGFLTRDSRAKERKKAGLKKARKRPQFSKR